MARISKRGLDYFPMGTHFMQDRSVRRLMKQEGDHAVCVLLALYSYIYDGEGYYLKVDEECLEDVAATFYHITAQQVRSVVEAAVRMGLFDRTLYTERGILTSPTIQRQYLFVKKRSAVAQLHPDICLLTENAENEGLSLSAEDEEVANSMAGGMPVQRGKNAAKCTQRKEKKSIAKQKKEKENLLLNPPPCQGEDCEEEKEEISLPEPPAADAADVVPATGAATASAAAGAAMAVEDAWAESSGGSMVVSGHLWEEASGSAQGDCIPVPAALDRPQGVLHAAVPRGVPAVSDTERDTLDGEAGQAPPEEATPSADSGKKKRVRKVWTPDDILALRPPLDGVKRNYAGLLENLRNYSIPPDEQYAIICKSNYGAIGHPVWKGFYTLRGSGGKIRLPGRYLLSLN